MTCGTKIRHATRDEAIAHIKQLVWKNHVAGESGRSVGLAPYPCDQCDSWHVGHQNTTPLAWHYTVVHHLDAIMAAGALKVPAPRVLPRKVLRPLDQRARLAAKVVEEPEPLLWLSWNDEWDHSVIKAKPFGRASSEILGGGLLRFGVPACFAKLRWSDYLARNPTPPAIRDAMAVRGNPSEWLATDEDIPLDRVRVIQVYFRGSWVALDDAADDFDRYLDGRESVYRAAQESLKRKLATVVSVETAMEVEFTEAERILFEDLEQLERVSAFHEKRQKKGGRGAEPRTSNRNTNREL